MATSSLLDLEEILPEDLFDETDAPQVTLESIATNFLVSQSELMGNVLMELFVTPLGEYYVKRSVREPIGDYGSHWVDYWFQCNNDDEVKGILEVHGYGEGD